ILGLLNHGQLSKADLAAGAAKILGVVAFSESSIQHYCDLLKRRGHVVFNKGAFEITDSGRRDLAKGDEGVVASQLSGREAVRKSVETSLGRGIPEQQWNLMWGTLQKELAHAFYVRGKQL